MSIMADDEVDCVPVNPFQDLKLNELQTSTEEKIHENGFHDAKRFYNMTHKKRGFVVVFNHDEFSKNLCLQSRPSSNRDYTSLCSTFSKFGFIIKEYFNQSYSEIMRHLNKYSKKNFSDHDCFMVVVLTHGKSGMLYAWDTDYKVDRLWNEFTTAKCPTLENKPKIFIVQACQGSMTDEGVEVEGEMMPAAVRKNGTKDFLDMSDKENCELNWDSYMNHFEPDFLIVFSSVPGFVSFKNQDGSWFIQELCSALENHAANDQMIHFSSHFLLLLTFVIQKIAFSYESSSDDNLEYDSKKQQPFFKSTLTRLLKFTPLES